MRTHEAAKQLLAVIKSKEEEEEDKDAEERNTLHLTANTTCIACVRLGSEKQQNVVLSLQGDV